MYYIIANINKRNDNNIIILREIKSKIYNKINSRILNFI